MKSSKPKGYWTKERRHEEALKYQTRAEFRKGSSAARTIASKKGWMNDICSHMDSPVKPKGYWTKELCISEASKYKDRSEFQRNSNAAWHAAQRNEWLDEIYDIVGLGRQIYPNGYWTKERVQEQALKFTCRVDFQKNKAYSAAARNGWIDEVCSHMERKVLPVGYWTKERVHEEALKYERKAEFRKECASAYTVAHRNNWIDDVCRHMVSTKKPDGYWTKEICQKEADKFTTRTDFKHGNGNAYCAAHRNGWLDDICEHMKIADHGYRFCLYAIVNVRKKQAYVGVTRQKFSKRIEEHRSKRNKTRSKNIIHLSGTETIQITDYIYLGEQVKNVEIEAAEQYRRLGFEILNCESAFGGIGSSLRPPTKRQIEKQNRKKKFAEFRKKNPDKPSNFKWSKFRCMEEAKKYKTKQQFRNGCSGAYHAAHKRGWIDDICAHMENKNHKKHGYWTKERCIEAALTCRTKLELRTKYPSARSVIKANGWDSEAYAHMNIKEQKPKGYWNKKDNCHKEALKFKTVTEFHKASSGAYYAAKKNGWLDEICSHMKIKKRQTNGCWSKERCKEEALKYKTRGAFRSGSSAARTAAQRNGWMDDICAHMPPPKNRKKAS